MIFRVSLLQNVLYIAERLTLITVVITLLWLERDHRCWSCGAAGGLDMLQGRPVTTRCVCNLIRIRETVEESRERRVDSRVNWSMYREVVPMRVAGSRSSDSGAGKAFSWLRFWTGNEQLSGQSKLISHKRRSSMQGSSLALGWQRVVRSKEEGQSEGKRKRKRRS